MMPNSEPQTNGAAEQAVPARPTSATEWRTKRTEGMLVTLPSGNVVRAKRTMDLMTLLRTGTIPNPLRGLIDGMIQGQAKGKPQTVNPDELSDEGFKQFLELLDSTIVKAVLEPPVVETPTPPMPPEDIEDQEAYAKYQEEMITWEQWEPEPGHISTSDFDLEDKMFIFLVAHGMVNDLSSFRQVTDQHMAAVQDGRAVQQPSQPATGDQ